MGIGIVCPSTCAYKWTIQIGIVPMKPFSYWTASGYLPIDIFFQTGATAYSLAYFGRGIGGIFLDNLYCTGRESRLIDCSHSGVGIHNCDHSADAGVRCQGIWMSNTTLVFWPSGRTKASFSSYLVTWEWSWHSFLTELIPSWISDDKISCDNFISRLISNYTIVLYATCSWALVSAQNWVT